MKIWYILGAVHNCPHLIERTKHKTFTNPPPPQKDIIDVQILVN